MDVSHSSEANIKTDNVIKCKKHLRDSCGHNAHNTERDNDREKAIGTTVKGDPESTKDEPDSNNARINVIKRKKHLRYGRGHITGNTKRNTGRKGRGNSKSIKGNGILPEIEPEQLSRIKDTPPPKTHSTRTNTQ